MIEFKHDHYTAYCKHTNTRNGFRHDCYMIDGYDNFKASIHYINRTWEAYTFETVLLKAAGELEKRCIDREKVAYLNRTGAKRITSAMQKEDFRKQLENNGEYQSIQILKTAIKNNTLHPYYIPDM